MSKESKSKVDKSWLTEDEICELVHKTELTEDNMTKIICAIIPDVVTVYEYNVDDEYINAVKEAFNRICDVVLERMNR